MAQISKEYGSALFDAAGEHDETDSVYEAAKQLSAIFQENPDYIELLLAPNLPKPERIALAKQALSGNVPDTLCAFVQLLCERGYLRCSAQYHHRRGDKRSAAASGGKEKAPDQARKNER